MHSSGWFKNPDYERCYHLSLSPAPIEIWTPDVRELNENLRNEFLKAFFGEHVDKVWMESPKSPEGKAEGVTHYRVFCDENWIPIIPRKEVYSTEFTELCWKSASELGIQIESNLKP